MIVTLRSLASQLSFIENEIATQENQEQGDEGRKTANETDELWRQLQVAPHPSLLRLQALHLCVLFEALKQHHT